MHLQICYERHTGKPLGYAVVHFDNPAAAQYAIDVLHNVEVDGRHIVVAPYRPRVSDASGPKPAARPPSRPGVDEAVALVMDLHKNATWMCESLLAGLARKSPPMLSSETPGRPAAQDLLHTAHLAPSASSSSVCGRVMVLQGPEGHPVTAEQGAFCRRATNAQGSVRALCE
jgi:hypothetical protein